MNWYSMLLFMLFSPIGWLINGLLLSVFIFANLKYNMIVNVWQRTLMAISPNDPRPAETIMFMTMRMNSQPLMERKGFWFTIVVLSGLALMFTLGFPIVCTFTSITTMCP